MTDVSGVHPLPDRAHKRPNAQDRPKLFRHPWRVAIVTGVLVLVLNLVVIVLANTDTSPGGRAPLPVTVESISPERGALTGLVDTITVDLRNDLTGYLVVDGQRIPDDQTDRVAELGVLSFRPGPGKVLTKFVTGDNTAVVYYWPRTKAEPAHPPNFGWRFQAAA
jgi:hypothetical protein